MCSACSLRDGRRLRGFKGRHEPQFFETPVTIVAKPEPGYRLPDFFEGAEAAAVDGLLLQGPVEAPGHAIGLGFGHERDARVDAPELDLFQEIVGGVLRATIRAQLEPLAGTGAARQPDR